MSSEARRYCKNIDGEHEWHEPLSSVDCYVLASAFDAQVKERDERLAQVLYTRGERDAQAQQLAAVREQVKACHDALDFAQGAISDAIHLEDGLDGATGEACLRIIVEAVERGTFDQADPKDIDIMTTHRRQWSDTIDKLDAQLASVREALSKLLVAVDDSYPEDLPAEIFGAAKQAHAALDRHSVTEEPGAEVIQRGPAGFHQ